jgi:hypothetical protein
MLHKGGFPDLANWLRFVRLTGNPYEPKHIEFDIWNEQIEYNVPLMIWSSIAIHNMCQEKGLTRILFATRDCCLMKKFFDKMYPHEGYETVTFHCSRKIYEKPTPAYIKYVKDCVVEEKTLFVDVNGTGRSLYAFFQKHMDDKQIEMFFTVWQDGMNILSKVKVMVGGYLHLRKPSPIGILCAASIEKWNYDLVGTLIGWDDKTGPIREEAEYPLELVSIYHEAANYAVEQLSTDNIEMEVPSANQVKSVLHRGELLTKLPKLIKHDEGLFDMLNRAKKIGDQKYFQQNSQSKFASKF